MKQIDIFIIILAILSISIIACNSNPSHRDVGVNITTQEQVDSLKKAEALYKDRNTYIQREKNGITIYTVDGHEYLYFTRESVIHNENCPNPKHIKL